MTSEQLSGQHGGFDSAATPEKPGKQTDKPGKPTDQSGAPRSSVQGARPGEFGDDSASGDGGATERTDVGQGGELAQRGRRTASVATGSIPWTSFLFLGWGLFVATRLGMYLTGWIAIRRWIHDAEPVTDASVLSAWESACRRLGMTVPPRLRNSQQCTTPLVIGVFRPTVLIPDSVLNGLEKDELESVFLHELIHVGRFDGVVRFAGLAAETLYFMFPWVWWANRRLGQLREDACDESTVIALDGRRKSYGAAIVKTAELVGYAPPAFAIGMRDSHRSTRGRLERLLDRNLPLAPLSPLRTYATIVVIALLLIPAGARQEAAEPTQPLAMADAATSNGRETRVGGGDGHKEGSARGDAADRESGTAWPEGRRESALKPSALKPSALKPSPLKPSPLKPSPLKPSPLKPSPNASTVEDPIRANAGQLERNDASHVGPVTEKRQDISGQIVPLVQSTPGRSQRAQGVAGQPGRPSQSQPDAGERQASAGVDLPSIDSVDQIIARLRNTALRDATIEHLCKSPELEPLVISLLSHETLGVRRVGTQVLAEIGTTSALPMLEDLYINGSVWDQRSAKVALDRIWARIPENPEGPDPHQNSKLIFE